MRSTSREWYVYSVFFFNVTLTYYKQYSSFPKTRQTLGLGFARWLTGLNYQALSITTWDGGVYGAVTELGPSGLDLGHCWPTIVAELGIFPGCVCVLTFHGATTLRLAAFGLDGCELRRRLPTRTN